MSVQTTGEGTTALSHVEVNVGDCTCRQALVDWVRRTVGHPYTSCPHYGTETRFQESERA